MNKKLKAIAGSLTMAFLFTACGAARPAVAEDIIQDSVAQCETGPLNGDEASYGARLRQMLSKTDVSSLVLLRENEVTICLDQRQQVKKDRFDLNRLAGIYYPSSNIVAVWDDGQSRETESPDLSIFGRQALENLAEGLEENSLSKRGIQIATIWDTEWKVPKDTYSATLKNAPELRTPPLRANAPKLDS